ncbi:hypothetical protein NL676_020091 [Syzygium grande]|nr:hypothetical protein NL676_020091 [Syzygium grande]
MITHDPYVSQSRVPPRADAPPSKTRVGKRLGGRWVGGTKVACGARTLRVTSTARCGETSSTSRDKSRAIASGREGQIFSRDIAGAGRVNPTRVQAVVLSPNSLFLLPFLF